MNVKNHSVPQTETGFIVINVRKEHRQKPEKED